MKQLTALLAIGALALAACGSSSSSPSASVGGGYGSHSSSAKTTAASNTAGGALTIEMHDNYFGTKTITGKPGSTVKVTLKNVGSNQHNFKIDGQKAADADVAPGKTGTATVTIPTSGTVQFYCEYHKGLGMVGTVKPA
jgi:plastocyanin